MEMFLTLSITPGPENTPVLARRSLAQLFRPPPSWIPSSLELKIPKGLRKEARAEAAGRMGNASAHMLASTSLAPGT